MVETSWGRNIKALREDRGLYQDELADELDTSQTTVSGWESRGVSIRKSNLKRLMDFFGVDEDAILSNENGYYARTRGYASKASSRLGMAMGLAPRKGMAHAGILEDIDVYDEETMVRIPQFLLDKDPDSYVVSTIGDCMNEVFGEGADLVVSPNAIPKDRSIVLATIDGIGSIVRRLHMGSSTWILSPESYNDAHEDIVITSDDERSGIIDGVITWFQSPNEME